MKQPLKKCFSVIKECQTLELLCRAGEEPLAPIFRFVKSLWPLRGFRPLSSFSTKELSFCINMSDLPVIHSSARTYIFVDALSAALGKMTTCLFFSRAGAFFPHFVEARGGGALLPFQCSLVALPVMCDPVLFDFICSLFITVIFCDLREQVRQLFGTTAWLNCLRQDSHSSSSSVLTLKRQI